MGRRLGLVVETVVLTVVACLLARFYDDNMARTVWEKLPMDCGAWETPLMSVPCLTLTVILRQLDMMAGFMSHIFRPYTNDGILGILVLGVMSLVVALFEDWLRKRLSALAARPL